MTKKPDEEGGKRSLNDEEISSSPSKLDRRTAMKVLGSSVLGAGAAAVATSTLGCIVSTPPTTYVSGVTDGDGGAYADPVNNGRGQYRTTYTNLTDSDSGPHADAAGYGRGHHGHGGWTSGLTDADGGPHADAAGNGRGTYRNGNTGLTDGDGGRYADPAGRGRGRYR